MILETKKATGSKRKLFEEKKTEFYIGECWCFDEFLRTFTNICETDEFTCKDYTL